LGTKLYIFCVNNVYIAPIIFLVLLFFLALESMFKPSEQNAGELE